MTDFFLQINICFSSQDVNRSVEWCGLLVGYCDVFSAVWTLMLMAPIHCRRSIGAEDPFP